jgi:vanadium-dependent haloperoxidase-like protein
MRITQVNGRARGARQVRAAAAMAVLLALAAASWTPAVAAGPNTVAQWNQIAENTVVGSGAFQNEGWIYMSYEATAVFDAVVAIEGGYEPYAPAIQAPAGASVDAAVVQAAYETLNASFPAAAASLLASYNASMTAIPDGQAKTDGMTVGHQAAQQIRTLRTGDGVQLPIGVSTPFPTKAPGPGVWRLTPPYAAPQTPWVGNVTPFVVPTADRYLPPPPPALDSPTWVADYNEIRMVGQDSSASRTATQTATAKFWSANVIRQYDRLVRDLADSRHLSVLETARLAAMVDVVAADAGISSMYAKYHYLFWRPVTAIDPSSVKPLPGDGFGPNPGFSDGNAATPEVAGWRPLLPTPNHPEYPSAHGTLTSAVTEALVAFLGTNRINVDIRGFDATGAAGNLDAVHHFNRANDLRAEIINARVWAGLHYRNSDQAGVNLGRSVAKYDLRHAFESAP